jgi:hypothetical protein
MNKIKQTIKSTAVVIACIGLLFAPVWRLQAQAVSGPSPVGSGGGGGGSVAQACWNEACDSTAKCLRDDAIALGITITACLVTGPGTIVCDPAAGAAALAVASACCFSGAADYAWCLLTHKG